MGMTSVAAAAPPVETGRFAWVSAPEPEAGEAALDLRALNDARAGVHGAVRAKGDQFVDAAGRPVRFWGMALGAAVLRLEPDAMQRLARRLARAGVNLARVAPPSGDGVAAFVAAMKAEGIVTDLVVDAGPGELWIVPEAQAAWRARVRALLSITGTGLGGRLGTDPALAFVEAGEGGVFAAGFARARVPELAWQKLENAFADWSRSRYGSVAGLRSAWLEAKEPGDDPSGGWCALYDAWHLGRDGMQGAGPGVRRRAADQARFLGTLERNAVAGMERFLHRDLKARALLVARLPATVDPDVLDAPAQWARAGADVLGVTRTFAPTGEWDRERGTGTFANRAAVAQPERSAYKVVRPPGRPCIVTSVDWPPPNLYRADGPWLGAVLAGLTGIAAVIWDDRAGAFGDDEPGVPGTAAVFGSFPACAALFRSGALRAAPAAVTQTIDPDDLWRLEATGREAALSPARLAAGSGPLGDLDPLAFAVGPVLREFSPKHPGERRADLAVAIDRSLHVVKAGGGAVAWDAGHGLVRLDTPAAQGVAGFCSRLPPIALSRLTISCENDYAAVLVVALDGLPLERSRRMLAQVMTTDRPAGFRASNGPDGEIQSAGSGPWTIERIRARLTLTGGNWTGAVVRALDGRGLAVSEAAGVTVPSGGESLSIALAPTGVFHLITR